MRRTKQDVNNLSKQNKIEPMGEEINTKVEIIECAVNLFKNHGYDQVTVAQICKEVGISKTSFYYHFSSKEDLVSDYILSVHEISARALNQVLLLSGSYLAQFWKFYQIYINKYLVTGYEIMSISYANKLKYHKSYLPGDTPSHVVYISLLEKSQAAGEIRNMADPTSLAATCVYLIRGIFILWSISGDIDLRETCRNALNDLFQPNEGFVLE